VGPEQVSTLSQRWAIDSGTPSTDPTSVERDPEAPAPMRHALLAARLRAERDAVTATAPPDVAGDLRHLHAEITRTRQLLVNIPNGTAGWEGTELGDLASTINTMKRERQEATWRSNSRALSRSEIRSAKRTIKTLDGQLEQLGDRFETMAAPHREELTSVLSSLESKEIDLENRTHQRAEWRRAHPEHARRLQHLDVEIARVDRALTTERNELDGIVPTQRERDLDRITETTRPALRRAVDTTTRHRRPQSRHRLVLSLLRATPTKSGAAGI